MKKEMEIVKEFELRNLAEMLVKTPEGTAIVASIFYENAKYGKRRVTDEAHENINDISEAFEDDIPIEVLRYLKKTKNVYSFFDFVRKAIVSKLMLERVFDEHIVKYVDCFDVKTLKKYLEGKRINKNLKKFIIMVCMEDAYIYYDDDPVFFMKLVKKLYSLDLNDYSVIHVLENLVSFYTPKSEGK